jgi:hypothetical protein
MYVQKRLCIHVPTQWLCIYLIYYHTYNYVSSYIQLYNRTIAQSHNYTITPLHNHTIIQLYTYTRQIITNSDCTSALMRHMAHLGPFIFQTKCVDNRQWCTIHTSCLVGGSHTHSSHSPHTYTHNTQNTQRDPKPQQDSAVHWLLMIMRHHRKFDRMFCTHTHTHTHTHTKPAFCK